MALRHSLGKDNHIFQLLGQLESKKDILVAIRAGSLWFLNRKFSSFFFEEKMILAPEEEETFFTVEDTKQKRAGVKKLLKTYDKMTILNYPP